METSQINSDAVICKAFNLQLQVQSLHRESDQLSLGLYYLPLQALAVAH